MTAVAQRRSAPAIAHRRRLPRWVRPVVVAYEIVRRYELAAEQRRVAAQLRARTAAQAEATA